MKEIQGSLEELSEIGKVALGSAHTIMNMIAVFGPAADEMSEIVQQAHEEDRALTETEAGLVASYLRMITDSTMRIEHSMKGILQYGRGLQFEMDYVHVNGFLKDMVELMRARGKFSIEYRLDLCPYLEQMKARMDRSHISNCILDLIKNAAEAGASSVNITTSMETTKEGQFAEITVANNGESIPEDVLAKIFDLKFTTKKKGNGVGLAQVRKIIEAHNGKIEVRSNPDRTEFRLVLPL